MIFFAVSLFVVLLNEILRFFEKQQKGAAYIFFRFSNCHHLRATAMVSPLFQQSAVSKFPAHHAPWNVHIEGLLRCRRSAVRRARQ